MIGNTLQGKRFLVTGGARRIGRAICLRLAAAGAQVVVHYRNSRNEAEELRRELEAFCSDHEKVQCELTVRKEREQLIPWLIRNGSPLDGLINNASMYSRARLADCEPDAVQNDYAVNFHAPFQLMRDFKHHCGRGTIINMLDQRVHLVDPGAGSYGLAKKSLRDATEATAGEWAPNIRVNAVAPGFVLPPPGVDPAKMDGLLEEIPMQMQTSPEEVAEAVYFLTNAETITGEILFVDGGMHLGGPAAQEKQ